MKDNETRRQMIRESVREMLPEVLAEIVKQQQYDSLKNKVEGRLTEVEAYIKQTMELMNTRQKEVLKYLVESYMAVLKPSNEESKVEDKASE